MFSLKGDQLAKFRLDVIDRYMRMCMRKRRNANLPAADHTLFEECCRSCPLSSGCSANIYYEAHVRLPILEPTMPTKELREEMIKEIIENIRLANDNGLLVTYLALFGDRNQILSRFGSNGVQKGEREDLISSFQPEETITSGYQCPTCRKKWSESRFLQAHLRMSKSCRA